MNNSIGPGSNQQHFIPMQQEQPQTAAQYHQPHIMPSPTESPWSLNSMPWTLATIQVQPGTVMEFSAPSSPMEQRTHHLHQKRKSDMIVSIPQKQYISEEKFTAHFNGLHISSDYIQTTSTITTAAGAAGSTGPDGTPSAATTTTTTITGKCFTNLTYEDYQTTARELEQKLRNANRITLCEQMQKLNEEQRKVSYIPEAIMHRIVKPCTDVVLWQPPAILELLKQKCDISDPQTMTPRITPTERDYASIDNLDDDFSDDSDVADAEIDDYLDNNNTCRVDFNSIKADNMMDQDL